MKPQRALTPDQMHELQSLGLDFSDASMAWGWIQCEHEKRLTLIARDTELPNVISPAYTLEDILLKLEGSSPRYIIEPNMSDWFYSVSYPTTDRCGSIKLFTALNNPMKPAFEMLKWVLKNHPEKIKRL